MLNGMIILISSFVLAIVVRIIFKNKSCIIAKVVPYFIMLVGGLLGSYLFLLENWEGLYK